MNAIITLSHNEIVSQSNGVTFNLTEQVITDKSTALALADALLVGAKSKTTFTSYRQAIAAYSLFMGEQGLPFKATKNLYLNMFKNYLQTNGNTWAEAGFEYLRKPLEGVSTNKYLAAVKMGIKLLVDNGEMDEWVLAGCRDVSANVVKKDSLAGQYIPLKERYAILDRIDGLSCEGDYKAMITAIFALLQFGLRRAEIAGLNVDSLKDDGLGNRELKVLGKRNKERTILIDGVEFGDLIADVESWVAIIPVANQGNGQPLFYQSDSHKQLRIGARISPESIYQLTKKIMGNYSPHDFRRSMVSDLLEAGVDISNIKAITGHESADMVTRYDRRGKEVVRRATTKLSIRANRRALEPAA